MNIIVLHVAILINAVISLGKLSQTVSEKSVTKQEWTAYRKRQ